MSDSLKTYAVGAVHAHAYHSGGALGFNVDLYATAEDAEAAMLAHGSGSVSVVDVMMVRGWRK